MDFVSDYDPRISPNLGSVKTNCWRMVKEILRCTHLDFESVELFDGLGSVVLIGKIDEHISGVVTDRLELVYLQPKLLEEFLGLISPGRHGHQFFYVCLLNQ